MSLGRGQVPIACGCRRPAAGCAGCFENLAEDLRRRLRLSAGRTGAPSAAVLDRRTRRSTPERGGRAGCDGAQKRKGSKVHAAVDTLGPWLAVKVTAANEQDRAQGGGVGASGPGGHRQSCAGGLRGSGRHGASPGGRGGGPRRAFGGGQAARGQTRFCPVAAPVGGGAHVRVGGTLPPPRAGTTNGGPAPAPATTGSPAPSSCASRCSLKVHDRL